MASAKNADPSTMMELDPTTASGERPNNIDGEDFSNYYCAYGYLYNQKEMLEDPDRMQAYYDSIIGNKRSFKGKTVLDVGTGSGILAIWAAQAGAKKVYAVEATYMAVHARELIKSNGLSDVIEVFQGAMEEVQLPTKVDIIVSEWMGYFLLRESMYDAVLHARDKWLNPGGALYPSHATMYIAPAFDFTEDRRYMEFQTAKQNWGHFSNTTKNKYGVDFSSLSEAYSRECVQYFYQNALWVHATPSQLLGPPIEILAIDMLTAKEEDLKKTLKGKVMMAITKQNDENPDLNAIVGWFTTDFKGSPENPADCPVQLSTAPHPEHVTHWGQQQFHVYPPVETQNGDLFSVDWEIRRQKQNQRLLEIDYTLNLESSDNAVSRAEHPTLGRRLRFNLN